MNNSTLRFASFVLCLFVFNDCKKETATPFPPRPVVNAGPSQTIRLPVDSVWLSGTAKDTVSKIVGYLWSEVSGPNVPVVADEGSRSTWVNGLTAGTYIFQLMAVDSLGLTGIDTVSVTVNPRSIDTLYLSNTDEETFLSDSTTFVNGNSGSPELLAETWTVGGTLVFGRSLFRFKIPPPEAAINSSVRSAKLTLYSDTVPLNGDLIHANYGTGNDFYIQRIASTWDPATTTWLNLPAVDTAGQVHIPQTNLPFLTLVDVDVTTLVNNMIASGNYGFEIRLNNEVVYNSRIFCSGIHPDNHRHPRLILTY